MPKVFTVLALGAMLLIGGCLSDKNPPIAARPKASGTDEGDLSPTPPSPPTSPGDQFEDPRFTAINMSRVGNCKLPDYGGTYAACVIMWFRVDARNSPTDLSFGSCGSYSSALSLVSDHGDRVECKLVSGKTKAVAGFASLFQAAFELPEEHNILRLDLASSGGVRHITLPPDVKRTFREAGIEIALSNVTTTSDCALDAQGRAERDYTGTKPPVACTIARIVVGEPPSNVGREAFRLKTSDGRLLTPLAIFTQPGMVNITFDKLERGTDFELIATSGLAPFTENSTIDTGRVRMASQWIRLSKETHYDCYDVDCLVLRVDSLGIPWKNITINLGDGEYNRRLDHTTTRGRSESSPVAWCMVATYPTIGYACDPNMADPTAPYQNPEDRPSIANTPPRDQLIIVTWDKSYSPIGKDIKLVWFGGTSPSTPLIEAVN